SREGGWLTGIAYRGHPAPAPRKEVLVGEATGWAGGFRFPLLLQHPSNQGRQNKLKNADSTGYDHLTAGQRAGPRLEEWAQRCRPTGEGRGYCGAGWRSAGAAGRSPPRSCAATAPSCSPRWLPAWASCGPCTVPPPSRPAPAPARPCRRFWWISSPAGG